MIDYVVNDNCHKKKQVSVMKFVWIFDFSMNVILRITENSKWIIYS